MEKRRTEGARAGSGVLAGQQAIIAADRSTLSSLYLNTGIEIRASTVSVN